MPDQNINLTDTNAYINQLLSLSRQVPDSVAEEDLPQLEQVATEFQHLFKQILHQDAGTRINVLDYSQRIKDIESALYHAKYGHDQRQRDASFTKARKRITSGIAALVQKLKDSIPPAETE